MRTANGNDHYEMPLPAPARVASSTLLPPLVAILCISLFGPQELGWLWVGSQVEGATQSLGAGLAVAFAGSVVSILATAWTARRLDALWLAVRRGAGARPTYGLFEPAMVLGTGLALIAIAVWILIFAGPGPSIAPEIT